MTKREGDDTTAFAEGVASYVRGHVRYAALTKEEVAAEAVKVVLTEPKAAREAAGLLTSAFTDDDLLNLLVERGVLRETAALARLRKDGTVKDVYGDHGDVDLLTAKTNLVPVWAVVRPSDSGATGASS